MERTLRTYLLGEAVAFAVAAAVHAGVLLTGFEHQMAATAESIISIVLFIGLGIVFVRPEWTRPVAFLAQAFALAGTSIGIFAIAVGFGPRTVPDVVYHVGIVAVLVAGLLTAWRGHGLRRSPA